MQSERLRETSEIWQLWVPFLFSQKSQCNNFQSQVQKIDHSNKTKITKVQRLSVKFNLYRLFQFLCSLWLSENSNVFGIKIFASLYLNKINLGIEIKKTFVFTWNLQDNHFSKTFSSGFHLEVNFAFNSIVHLLVSIFTVHVQQLCKKITVSRPWW